jgi:uncharacterized protein (TIGR02217 family)
MPVVLVDFDEVLLNPEYSEFAKGGPEYVTGIERSPHSGIYYATVHRLDAIWRGEIDYSLMSPTQLDGLNEFFRGGFGRAVGFRFAPPYDYTMTDEPQAVCNGATQYKIYKSYSRPGSLRVDKKRVVKPVGPGLFWYDGVTARQNTCVVKLNGVVDNRWLIDSAQGLIKWNGTAGTQPTSGTLTLTCEYDLPMMLDVDHFNPSVDDTTNSEVTGLPLVEILPAALGIAY